ncbi:acyltransferase, partial [Yersinia sp. 2544 StPb PI]|uniref:acyltransferase family protein n=1 Tax=Yersinia sp. 2544 StPb PI TaxID=3117409 RepID=UPI003B27BCE0
MSRNYGLDIARIAAAYMVMFGHIVYGGTLSVGRPFTDWAGTSEKLPLLEQNGNSWWLFDHYLLTHYGTALAIIGVSLFFIISGWLMPPMLNKYGRINFLLNRVFRIFPMLFVAVIIAALIQFFGGDRSTLNIVDVISTATLTNKIFGLQMTLGVIWTLIIEFQFYLILSFLGVITQRKVITTALMFLLLVTIIAKMNVGEYCSHIISSSYYIVFMLIGSSARIAFDEYKIKLAKKVFIYPLITFFVFEFIRYLTVYIIKINPGQEINIISQMLILLLFITAMIIGLIVSSNIKIAGHIGRISDLTYSIYLLHLSVGIFVLSRIRHLIQNEYVCIVLTFIVVIFLS